MAGKRIIFIPFEGGVSADSSINGTVKTYQDTYRGCRVVEWPYYFAEKDWSSKQSESPLGEGVNVIEDVIIVVGHGNFDTSKLGVNSGTKKAGLTLTKHKPEFLGEMIILNVEEVAARLRWMGLRSNHKYIKTLSCCGAGIGDYDPGTNQLNVLNLNDKYPHAFASSLAKELGKTHPNIRVGGYPGYVDCKYREKIVSPRIPKKDDDASVVTKMEDITNPFGSNKTLWGTSLGQVQSRELYNRYSTGYLGRLDGRVINLPVKKCPECMQLNGHTAACTKSQKREQLVPVIWYDAAGCALMDKRSPPPPPPPGSIPLGFRKQS